MAINRRSVPEAEKRAQLIMAARELFLQESYEVVSIGRISKAAGVAPNTIYWYFRDKEQLLLSVIEQILQEGLVEFKALGKAPLSEQFVWLVMHLQPVSQLISTVHERASVSPEIAQWHDRFHLLIEQLFCSKLSTLNGSKEIEVRILSYAIEGMATHQLDEHSVRQTCESLAARFAAA